MLFLTLILRCYIIVAFVVFLVFLLSFLQDKTTRKNHKGSWKVLGLAAIFWPIVVPLACLERHLKKSSAKTDDSLEVEEWNDVPAQPKKDNVIYLHRYSKKPPTFDGSGCPIYPIEKKIQG